MKTEDFVARLAANTAPVARGALVRRLLLASLGGALIAVLCVAALYGLRPDLGTAVLGTPFWMKATFTMGVAAFALLLLERAARPGADLHIRLALLILPLAFILIAAVSELALLPRSERVATWLGSTWRTCAFSIAGLSIPVLALALLALRRLAPTRPAVAGLAAGLLSGGLAASAYGLHCPETSAAFVATWYLLGVLGSGLLGAAAGARLLRW
jgi:hypothetical protein